MEEGNRRHKLNLKLSIKLSVESLNSLGSPSVSRSTSPMEDRGTGAGAESGRRQSQERRGSVGDAGADDATGSSQTHQNQRTISNQRDNSNFHKGELQENFARIVLDVQSDNLPTEQSSNEIAMYATEVGKSAESDSNSNSDDDTFVIAPIASGSSRIIDDNEQSSRKGTESVDDIRCSVFEKSGIKEVEGSQSTIPTDSKINSEPPKPAVRKSITKLPEAVSDLEKVINQPCPEPEDAHASGGQYLTEQKEDAAINEETSVPGQCELKGDKTNVEGRESPAVIGTTEIMFGASNQSEDIETGEVVTVESVTNESSTGILLQSNSGPPENVVENQESLDVEVCMATDNEKEEEGTTLSGHSLPENSDEKDWEVIEWEVGDQIFYVQASAKDEVPTNRPGLNKNSIAIVGAGEGDVQMNESDACGPVHDSNVTEFGDTAIKIQTNEPTHALLESSNDQIVKSDALASNHHENNNEDATGDNALEKSPCLSDSPSRKPEHNMKKSDAKEGSGGSKSSLSQETVRDVVEREVDRRTSIAQHLNADVVSSVVREIESELVNQIDSTDSSDRSALNPNCVSGEIDGQVSVHKEVTLGPDPKEGATTEKEIGIVDQLNKLTITDEIENASSIHAQEICVKEQPLETPINELSELIESKVVATDELAPYLIALNESYEELEGLIGGEKCKMLTECKEMEDEIRSNLSTSVVTTSEWTAEMVTRCQVAIKALDDTINRIKEARKLEQELKAAEDESQPQSLETFEEVTFEGGSTAEDVTVDWSQTTSLPLVATDAENLRDEAENAEKMLSSSRQTQSTDDDRLSSGSVVRGVLRSGSQSSNGSDDCSTDVQMKEFTNSGSDFKDSTELSSSTSSYLELKEEYDLKVSQLESKVKMVLDLNQSESRKKSTKSKIEILRTQLNRLLELKHQIKEEINKITYTFTPDELITLRNTCHDEILRLSSSSDPDLDFVKSSQDTKQEPDQEVIEKIPPKDDERKYSRSDCKQSGNESATSRENVSDEKKLFQTISTSPPAEASGQTSTVPTESELAPHRSEIGSGPSSAPLEGNNPDNLEDL